MRKKEFWSGMLTMFLLITMIGTVFAKTGTVTQDVVYNDIGVIVDGKKLDLVDANGNSVEPFMYNNTNYLPVRAIGEALGLTVSFDGTQNAVVLTSENSTQIPTTPSGNYSRTNPAPIGTAQQITVTKYWGSYTATVEITKAYRGQTAWAAIRDANRYNDSPTENKEYILASVKVTIDSVSVDSAVDMSKYDFTAFSSSNSEYTRVSTVDPSPKFDGSSYAGGTTEGFVSFVVDTDDPAPKVVYGADSNGSGGIWFSLV